MDPNALDYYNIINKNRSIIYNIQNILINDKIVEILDRDHVSIGKPISDNELFSAKAFTFNYGRLQSYELLTFNGIISVNHITLDNRDNNINNIKFVIFRWIKTDYTIIDNDTKLYIAEQYIESNYSIHVMEQDGFLIFYADIVYNFINDIIIGFSINREFASNITIRPDITTVCEGLIRIKERRDDPVLKNYSVTPSTFDPDGIHYFELTNYNLGFVLYGPWDNVASSINNINVVIMNNGVRYISI